VRVRRFISSLFWWCGLGIVCLTLLGLASVAVGFALTLVAGALEWAPPILVILTPGVLWTGVKAIALAGISGYTACFMCSAVLYEKEDE
jgi:hypothetical protein